MINPPRTAEKTIESKRAGFYFEGNFLELLISSDGKRPKWFHVRKLKC